MLTVGASFATGNPSSFVEGSSLRGLFPMRFGARLLGGLISTSRLYPVPEDPGAYLPDCEEV
jgi:hypothetical protein